MINFEHIANIQTRINEIEQMVRMRPEFPRTDFQNTLRKEMERMQNASKPSTEPQPQSKPAVEIAEQEKNAMPLLPTEEVSQEDRVERQTSVELFADDREFSEMIAAAAQKYHVDPKLVSAVAEAESGGDQSAISSVGAIGVMQLMPDTAAALGVDPYDKEQNIEGGAKYLRQMLDSFGGDLQKAVAAYNAGPQAVRDYGGIPPYAETQNYVEHVLDLYR